MQGLSSFILEPQPKPQPNPALCTTRPIGQLCQEIRMFHVFKYLPRDEVTNLSGFPWREKAVNLLNIETFSADSRT